MMTSWNGVIFRVTGHCEGTSPHKGQWHGALLFSLICVWINGWVNNSGAGDLRCHRAHYDVTVMICTQCRLCCGDEEHIQSTLRCCNTTKYDVFTTNSITELFTPNSSVILSRCCYCYCCDIYAARNTTFVCRYKYWLVHFIIVSVLGRIVSTLKNPIDVLKYLIDGISRGEVFI